MRQACYEDKTSQNPDLSGERAGTGTHASGVLLREQAEGTYHQEHAGGVRTNSGRAQLVVREDVVPGKSHLLQAVSRLRDHLARTANQGHRRL